nr:FAD-dependent monooxygenase [Chryseosolibacter indicus]
MAIALQKKGFNVLVYEQATAIKPLGAGLVLAANAIKAFAEIGIDTSILEAGKILKALRIKNTDGSVLAETDSEKLANKFGLVNNFAIHRADLHQILIHYLQPGTLRLNKGCVGFQQQPNGVTLEFHDGSTAFADYVIACDGIHSVIRKKLLPESETRYAGYTCWRAVIDNIPDTVDMTETTETWGRGCRFGIAPLRNNKLYWFACINAKKNDPLMRAMHIPDLLTFFSNFHSPVTDIIKHTQSSQLIWNDIIDIKPIKRFAFGNIVLLGDAAHATTPNMGQGACMAIEDAATLANYIEAAPSAEEAFTLFEKKRIKRTTDIVNKSWYIGKIAQLDHPLLVSIRNKILKLTPPKVAEKQVQELANVTFN